MGYIFDIRKKLGHDPIILTGAGVVLVNDKKEILLGRRADNGYWAYPAGSMELAVLKSAPEERLRKRPAFCAATWSSS